MSKATNILTITPRQCNGAAALTILAQEFMPINKRFGLFIWGASGIGKNAFTDKLPEVMAQVQDTPYELVDFNCSAREPTDITGLPYIKKAEAKDGIATSDFAPMYNWSSQTTKGIFRCDEMDRPQVKQVIGAVVKYAIDRTDKNVLPMDWFVLGQGNGQSDTNTTQLSDHVKGRFLHVYASINSKEAQRDIESYFSEIGASPAIMALNRLSPCESNDAAFKPHAQDQVRTRHFAECIIKAYDKYGDSLREAGCPVDALLRPLLAGCIGVALANETVRLLEFSALPSLGEVVNNPNKAEVSTDLSLSVKFVQTLCDFVSCDHEAEQLAIYIGRYPAEIKRMGLEKLAALWNVVPFPAN